MLKKRRNNYLKLQTQQIEADKLLWEDEWREKINAEVMIKKQGYEKIIQDLAFQKRLLETSLFRRRAANTLE